MNMRFNRELFSPQELKRMYGVSAAAAAYKEQNDKEIRGALDGTSKKLLLVIGPCSADREDAVLDYISRLRPLQDKVADKISLAVVIKVPPWVSRVFYAACSAAGFKFKKIISLG